MSVDLDPRSSDLAAFRFKIALIRWIAALERASYNPARPRVPAGSNEGGRWTSGDGAGGATGKTPVRLAQGGPVEADEPLLPEAESVPLEALPARARRPATAVLGNYAFRQGRPIVEITSADYFDLSETTSLIRWERAIGGSLGGKTVVINADRNLCRSCQDVLPFQAFKPGDPLVIVREPSGTVRLAEGKQWFSESDREKSFHFPKQRSGNWPPPAPLARLFLDNEERTKLWSGGNDNWGSGIYGLNGSGHLPPYARVGGRGPGTQNKAHLTFWANPDHGLLLYQKKFGNGLSIHRFSRGDVSRLKKWVRTTHDDLRPVGLYIPFERAWPAIKDFMETEGELPKSIEWIKPEELPVGTFPDPSEHPEVK